MKTLDTQLVLVSHVLCPYVQRAAIVLAEKGVAFERRDVDLARKPDWFLAVSPLGKTPVLLVGGEPIFESAVICEYLDECYAPRLHPGAALQRAQHRAWIELASALLGLIAGFYNAPSEELLEAKRADMARCLARLEAQLARTGEGAFFDGARFSMVDAAFGPVFRYFDGFDAIEDFGVFDGLPKVRAWRRALAVRASVRAAVHTDYEQRLTAFLRARNSALSRRMPLLSPAGPEPVAAR